MDRVTSVLGISMDAVRQEAEQQRGRELPDSEGRPVSSATPGESSDTIEHLAELYELVKEECQAGRHRKAFAEVYWPRICKSGEQFSWRHSGKLDWDLEALAGFFEVRWHTPVASLRQHEKALVLHTTGCVLRAMGCLKEAAEASESGLKNSLRGIERAEAAPDRLGELETSLQGAVMGAFSLSTLYLITGDLGGAREYGKQGIKHAERSQKPVLKALARTIYSNILHQQGEGSDPSESIRLTEKMYEELEHEFRFVSYHQRFFACEVLLMQDRFDEVIAWTEKKILLDRFHADRALDYLSLGYAHLLLAKRTRRSPPSPTADYLSKAVEGLREAGNRHHIPRALLARADVLLLEGNTRGAQADMEEAMGIARKDGMGLFLADCHLSYARLHLALCDTGRARDSLNAARTMIQRMGYHRRDKEVAELERRLSG
jgi:tetratricopeptide (TPR) repeat protein